jgi:hypothetical protein
MHAYLLPLELEERKVKKIKDERRNKTFRHN